MAESKAVQKLKKKKWYAIKADALFNNALLGETHLAEAGKLSEKMLTVNLATLSGDLRQQNITLSFKVTSVQDNTATAGIVGYTLSPSAVKRLVGRRGDRIDAQLTCETADGCALTVKPLLLTAFSSRGSVQKAVRKAVIEAVSREVKTLQYADFVQAVLNRSLQTAVKKSLNKLFPIKAIEVRTFSARPSAAHSTQQSMPAKNA